MLLFRCSILFLFTLSFYGQQNDSCDWIQEIRSSSSTEDQLELIKSNYIFSYRISHCLHTIKYQTDTTLHTGTYWNKREFDMIKSEQLNSISIIDQQKGAKLEQLESLIVLNFNCDWVYDFEKVKGIEEKMGLLQNNFGPCILVVAHGRPLSSDSSSYLHTWPYLFINSIKQGDVSSINILRGKAAKTLYGTAGKNGVIVLTFKNENTMNEIGARMFKNRKN